jgi:hypothetical protein
MTRLLILVVGAATLAACNNNKAHSSPADMGPIVQRTLITNRLFGDTHPQNLLIDPSFSVRGGGVGTWMSQTTDPSQTSAAYAASLMSDSPASIALPVAHLSDNAKSTGNWELTLMAQVPGGPGPFHLRVWVSTLDLKASTDVSLAAVSLLGSLNNADAVQVDENVSAAKVIAGRTWHLFEGDLMEDRPLGGFVQFDFQASTNTWLLQAPEFVPSALIPTQTPELLRRTLPARHRQMTAREHAIVDNYRKQPRISVPASHPAISGRDREQLK